MKFRAVELNRLDEETIANIRTWRNQDFVRKNMFNTHIITEEEHKRYIDKVKQDPNRGLFVFYLDGEPFGVFQYEVNPKERSVTNGNYLIDEEYQSLGYGAIMNYMIGVMEYTYLDVDRVCGEVIDTNQRALKTNLRFGVVVEEVMRNHVILEGVAHDVYRVSSQAGNPEDDHKMTRLMKRLIDWEPVEELFVF